METCGSRPTSCCTTAWADRADSLGVTPRASPAPTAWHDSRDGGSTEPLKSRPASRVKCGDTGRVSIKIPASSCGTTHQALSALPVCANVDIARQAMRRPGRSQRTRNGDEISTRRDTPPSAIRWCKWHQGSVAKAQGSGALFGMENTKRDAVESNTLDLTGSRGHATESARPKVGRKP